MVDPLQAVLGAIASNAIGRAFTAILGPDSSPNVKLSVDSSLFALTDAESNEVVALLTEPQLRDIEAFLESEEIATLLQAWCVCTVLGGSEEPLEFAAQLIPDTFGEMARRWRQRIENLERADASQDWLPMWHEVWALVRSSIGQVLSRLAVSRAATAEIEALMDRYTLGSALLRGGGDPKSIHVRDLAELLANPRRIIATPQVRGDLRKVARRKHAQLVLSHVNDEYRIDEKELYIDRHLILLSSHARSDLSANGRFVQTRALTESSKIVRTIIIGDPGAGKSTLVRHISYDLSGQASDGVAPILVICREYVATGSTKPFLRYIADQIAVEESVDIPAAQIGDLLTLGCACVIFDGIDEVLDPSTRRTIIDRIEAFADRYPLVTVITTSRKEGYGQARFSQDFDLVELAEFDDSEAEQYVRSWFRLMKRGATEASSLLHELESLRDISNNPLMLSLLCTLYKARGFIPRNRRDIYRDCAELLFERWDSMRHIEPPYDHKQYGQRLIQELAWFYFSSQTAQAGIDEKQLTGVIAAFFRDTAGVERPDDNRRARDFLKFCAGRAWLLTSRGTNRRGIRIFTFTHRTFMEYYASEAIVRRADTLENISEIVKTSFQRDASSLLPDVIVQAADDKFDRGAERILRLLLAEISQQPSKYGEKFFTLCLRILNGSVISRAATDMLPMQMLMRWRDAVKPSEPSLESARVLFSLHRDARNSLLKSISKLELSERLELWRIICQHWVQLAKQESIESVEPAWAAEITTQLQILVDHSALSDAELINFASKLGLWDLGTAEDSLESGLAAASGKDGSLHMLRRPLQAALDILTKGKSNDAHSKRQLEKFANEIALGQTFTYSAALRVTDFVCDGLALIRGNSHDDLHSVQHTEDIRACLGAITGLALVTWQVRADNDFDRLVSKLTLGVSGAEASDYRSDELTDDAKKYVRRISPNIDATTKRIIAAWLSGHSLLY